MNVVPLADVATIVRGVTFRPSDVVEVGAPGSIAVMRTKNIQSELDQRDVIAVDRGCVRRSEQLLQTGDVLVSSANSWSLVGKCCPVPELANEATLGGFITAVRGDRRILDRRYLYRWLSTPASQARLRSLARQTTNIANLDLKRLAALELPLPPLAEQRRIADVLDRADTLRAKRRETLERLDELTQSIFVSMFGGAHDPRWSRVSVDSVGSVQLGRQRAPKFQTGTASTPYLRVANVHRDRFDLRDVLEMDFTTREKEVYGLRCGDILLNEGQSTELVGRPALWREEKSGFCFQNTLVRFRPDRTHVDPEYALAVFLQWLDHGEFARISSKTSSVAHLGAARFARMQFPLAPIAEQRRFGELVTEVREMKMTALDSLARLGELFASLQQRAFRGDLFSSPLPPELADVVA